ncbi:MAG: YigZ family protein [Phaeodactylibacter sp.]|nr:YigZ family protein [Phaeodactylibacter sp.]
MLRFMEDTYQTLAEPSTGEFKDRGSKFLAYAYPVYEEEEIQLYLDEVRKLHPKARHHCYAWRLGLDGNQYRANDDGEPSGTAGRPILGQLDSFEVTNTLIVVVRYFGGTLLGTSGLINAYRASAADALEQAEIIQKTLEDIYALTFDYSLMPQVMNAVKKMELEMVQHDFGNIAILQIALRQGQKDADLLRLKAQIGNLRIEEVNDTTQIEGLQIEFLYTR